MATTKKTGPAPSTFVKYDKTDKTGKKVLDKQTTANPALRNELLTSGYREEKPKATPADSSSGSGSGSASGSTPGSTSGSGK